jgi:hypothetical protein
MLHDFCKIGRMQILQLFMRDPQLYSPQGIGLD